MTSNLQFDFLANKENNTLTIRREFAAGRQLVWDCYTKAELLNQWFAPKPFTTKTKSMDFSKGGHWHYAMIDPANGAEYWGWTEYTDIQAIDSYQTLDAFSNEAGEVNTELPRAKWIVTFTDKGAHTLVETVVTYASLQDLETTINMGMQEGMASTLEKLDELLRNLHKITVTTLIAADVQKVWDYYTTPEHITKWNFADPSWHCPSASNDMRVGGKYVARMEAKDGSFGFDFEAFYSEINKGKNFTYKFGDRAAQVTFESIGDKTTLAVCFDPESENPIELQKGGWQAILDNFKNYVETN
jgi:uncharacterized protein YndB with AHSA1/START domain